MHLKTLFQSESFYKCIICFGVICIVGSIVLGWGGIEFMLHFVIRKMMRLIPGTMLWETWKTIPLPVYIKFNLFNITNPEDLPTGGKAVLNEMGPYVFLVDFDKTDFSINKTMDTIQYTPSRTYIFQPDKSNGKEDDLVTYINVIYLGVSHIAHEFTDVDFLLDTLDGMLADKGERLTRTDKVKDLLFDGVSIQTYVDLVNDPLVQQAGGEIGLPENFKDGLFALFKGKNGTGDGKWECHSGIRDSAELGQVFSYHGKTKLDIYNGESCNAIQGGDGTLNPPFIEPGVTDLHVFIPELCRSIKWEFVKEVNEKGISIARYRFPDLQSVPENPELACYCPKNDSMECDLHGVANLAACFGGAPMLYTKPHFLNVNSSIRKLVEGIQPNSQLHESRLDIHPLTGAAVTASIKMQFSIELVPWPAMTSFRSASRAIIPLAWVELVAKLEGLNLVMIKSLSFLLKVLPIGRWLAFLGSLCLIFIGAFLIYRSRKHNLVANDELDLSDEKDIGVWIKKFNQNDTTLVETDL